MRLNICRGHTYETLLVLLCREQGQILQTQVRVVFSMLLLQHLVPVFCQHIYLHKNN